MQIEDNQNISDYFSKMSVVVNQMKTRGATNTDQQVVENVMGSLTSRFDFTLVVIQ